jgi:hypothetical protein
MNSMTMFKSPNIADNVTRLKRVRFSRWRRGGTGFVFWISFWIQVYGVGLMGGHPLGMAGSRTGRVFKTGLLRMRGLA